MAYLELFERVADHVRRQGVTASFHRGKALSASVIQRASMKALIPIPSSMADFYAEVGDGMVFYWAVEGDHAPFAGHEFPKLEDRTVESLDDLIRWKIEWDDDYDFRHTENPTLAKQTALKMREWLPFHDEGNGDQFCLDTSIEPAPVVFDQHDWFDGGSGENGHRLGGSLIEFYTAWAQVCFQLPSGLWWPNVFIKSGEGVNWSSEQFREPFRLPARGG